MSSWENLWAGAQFFVRLPLYLARPLSFEQARAAMQDRLSRRERLFLEKVRLDVFDQESSPYQALLREARCEYGDIESGVSKDGVEATLRSLFQAGVYLTIDELKGRKTVRRGQTEIALLPHMLRAPRASYHLPASSGGSRSAGTPVLIDLSFIRACASNAAVCFASRDGRDWRKASWESPGAGLRFRIVKYAGFGDPPAASFSFFDPNSDRIPSYFRWNLRAMAWSSPLSGRPLPRPVHAPLTDPTPLAHWLRDTLRAGETPHLFTFPGAAVTLCRWATDHDVDIAGARFTISGEPVTAARIASMKAAGVVPIPRYGTMEVGAIGYGCEHGEHPDDVHLLTDMHGMIQAGADGEAAGLPEKALLITGLHPQSPFVMLNVSMGDQAEMAERRCGCGLEAAGWTTHLWNIRSYEKLTGGGVTFEAGEVIPVIEQTLPARFGGAPTDYQLFEAERTDGTPILRLRVDPRLGELDPHEISEVFLQSFAAKSVSASMMVDRWRESGTLEVERKTPAITKAGKINFLHADPPVKPS